MSYVTRSAFRADMSAYLKQVKKGDILYVGTREEKEFIVLPCELIDEEDIALLQSTHLAALVAERRQQKTIGLEEVEHLLG